MEEDFLETRNMILVAYLISHGWELEKVETEWIPAILIRLSGHDLEEYLGKFKSLDHLDFKRLDPGINEIKAMMHDCLLDAYDQKQETQEYQIINREE